MKKLLLFSAFAVLSMAALAQLQAPTLTYPPDSSTVVDVNVRLTWNPALGGTVTGYEAELSLDTTFTTVKTFPISGTSSKTDELTYGSRYYWRARGLDATGSPGPWSQVRTFTTFLDEFTGLAPSGGNKQPKLNLGWDTVAGTDTYHYEYDVDPAFSAPLSGNVAHDPNNFTNNGRVQVGISDLAFGQTYYFRIYSEHSKDRSDWSTNGSFTVLDQIELKEPLDSAINQEPKGELSCEATNGVTEYRFQIDNSTNYDPQSPDFVQITAFTDKVNYDRFYFGRKYFWRVQGVNSSGTSSWSSSRSFTVLDAVTLKSPADNAEISNEDVIFEWDIVNGAEQYIMQYGNDQTFSNFTEVITPDDTNKVKLDLEKTTDPYYWRVQTLHSKDTSGWSVTRSFDILITGIASVENDFSSRVYPNPASDVLNIEFTLVESSDVVIRFFNVLGTQVDVKRMSEASGRQLVLYDVSSLKKGVYIMTIDAGGERLTERITIR